MHYVHTSDVRASTYEACVSPTHKGNSAIQCLQRDNVIRLGSRYNLWLVLEIVTYSITRNFHSRKLPWIGGKQDFHEENFRGLLVGATKNATPPKFAEKTIIAIKPQNSWKFPLESFPPRKFPTIRYAHIQWVLTYLIWSSWGRLSFRIPSPSLCTPHHTSPPLSSPDVQTHPYGPLASPWQLKSAQQYEMDTMSHIVYRIQQTSGQCTIN